MDSAQDEFGKIVGSFVAFMDPRASNPDFSDGPHLAQLALCVSFWLTAWLTVYDTGEWEATKHYYGATVHALGYFLERQARLERLAHMPYPDYLQSKEWKRRAARMKKLWGECRACRNKSNLHLHHLRYERRGHEGQDDLVVLCAECHKAVHAGTLNAYRDEIGFLKFAESVPAHATLP